MATRKKALPTTAYRRLQQDYRRLLNDPVPYIVATPRMENILEWHYIITGPENSPYYGGYYHGKLVFPHDYPFKPPSIYMITPNGRFKCNTRLCLSISDFHPDTWNPAWSVSTILTGLLSFMLEDHVTLGSITTTTQVKTRLAKESLSYNLKDVQFCEIFSDIVEPFREELAQRIKNEQNAHDSTKSGANGMLSNSTEWGHNSLRETSSTILKHLCVLGAVAVIGYGLRLVLNHAQEFDQ